jgi:hypothetical protein
MSHDGCEPDGSSGHHDGQGLDSYGLGHFDGQGELAPHMCIHAFDQGDAGHTTAEAVVISHCFGDNALGHNNSAYGEADTTFNHEGDVGHNADGATCFQVGGLEKQEFAIVVVGHGFLNLGNAIKQYLLSQKALEVMGRQALPKPLNNHYSTLKPIRKESKTSPAIMPEGYFPGANGTTTDYRSLWQMGTQGLLASLLGWPAKRNPKIIRTYMEISATQWFYGSTGDYETRLLVRVVSPVGYNPILQAYCHRKGELASHLTLAQNLANHMLEELRAAKPTENAVARRKQLH